MRASRSLVAVLTMLVLQGELLLPPASLHAQSSRRQQSARKPHIIRGVLHYQVRGLSAALGGLMSGVLVGVGTGVALQRILSGLKFIVGAPGISDQSGAKEINDLLRSTDQIDLSGLPLSAGYDAEVFFTLEEGKDKVFRLKSGTVTWSADHHADLQVAGANGNAHKFSDSFRGQGSAPLNPSNASITLTLHGKGRKAALELNVDIRHPKPIQGQSVWSAMGGLVVITVRENGTGTLEWKVDMPSVGGGHVERQEGPVSDGGFSYTRRGPAGRKMQRGRETWQDLTDSGVFVEYELFGDCEAEIMYPPKDGQLVYDDASPATIAKQTDAWVSPSFWSGDLIWDFPYLRGSDREPDPDQAVGPEVDFSYTRLPEENTEFGHHMIKAEFGSRRGQGNNCKDPPDQPVRFFFQRDAENNPAKGLPKPPNWFHYWKQTKAGQGHSSNIVYAGSSGSCVRDGEPAAYGYYPFGDRIHICDLRKLDFSDEHLLTKRKVTGIDVFAVTVIHEWQHLLDYKRWWGGGYSVALDGDNDLIPDALESRVAVPAPFNRHKKYFSRQTEDTPGFGQKDEHYFPFAAELDWKPGTANRDDWSCPGKQSSGGC